MKIPVAIEHLEDIKFKNKEVMISNKDNLIPTDITVEKLLSQLQSGMESNPGLGEWDLVFNIPVKENVRSITIYKIKEFDTGICLYGR